MKILFFGDIVGRIGRKAIIQNIAQIKKQYSPDLVLANGENLAHGKGVTVKTIGEVIRAGIDYLTGGNHIWAKKEDFKKAVKAGLPILRPANYASRAIGNGFIEIKVGKSKVLLINLISKIFVSNHFSRVTNPFLKADQILKQVKPLPKIILIDFHAEVTAEKVCLGHYLDGRVSAVLGTHTHIPTADERILPQGSAYLTDIGMVGAKESSIGVDKELVIQSYLKDRKPKFEIPKTGKVIMNAVLLDIDTRTGKAKKIKRIIKTVNVK